MTPEGDISDAIARGDRQAVKAWLNAEDSDVNSRSVYGQTLLCTTYYDTTWALDDAVARAPYLVSYKHYVAAKRLIKGVIAAGSYKKYVRLPLQELLNLLSLAQRGHATTIDPVMKSLVCVDNHVVWNVLTYWVES